MLDTERRFAIIIGINDYEVKPLNYCVNDAVEIKQKLIERCRFSNEDIFLITSSNESSNKEITGKYMEAIRSIRSCIEPNKDSILFYFAGHGNYKIDKSNISFHDSDYPIVEIFNDISQLNPKIQFYIIDSCQSGGKVLTRDNKSEGMLEKYISSSSGAMLLYACQSNEYAWEKEEKQHGLLTYHFIKSLEKDELYDDEGILTPSRIQEYVSRETSKSSDFEQIPVTENRITGYYPFALLNNEENTRGNNISEDTIQKIVVKDNALTYNKESRIKLQKLLLQSINLRMDKLAGELKSDYQITTYNDINDINLNKMESLIEKLVVSSREKKIEPINKIYQTEKKINPSYNALTLSVNSLFKSFESDTSSIPKHIIKHIITSDNEYFESRVDVFLSDNIHKVSFGVGFVIYQSKWGLVLTTLVFKIEWDGEKDNTIDLILKNDYPFLLEENLYNIVNKLELAEFNNIRSIIEQWNQSREVELENFIKVSVKYIK